MLQRHRPMTMKKKKRFWTLLNEGSYNLCLEGFGIMSSGTGGLTSSYINCTKIQAVDSPLF